MFSIIKSVFPLILLQGVLFAQTTEPKKYSEPRLTEYSNQSVLNNDISKKKKKQSSNENKSNTIPKRGLSSEMDWGEIYRHELFTDNNYPGNLYENGYIDASKYPGIDPSGQKDSTAGLQKAIDDGINSARITYLAKGTYLVSDTLTGLQIYNKSGCA